MKNGSQNRWKFRMHFKRVFGGSWGQHGPKSLPKAPENEAQLWFTLVPCWVLEGTWGALGASWGPRADFDRFLIDFWSILSDFWSIWDDCWSIVDKCLDDFWRILEQLRAPATISSFPASIPSLRRTRCLSNGKDYNNALKSSKSVNDSWMLFVVGNIHP